MTIPKYKFEMPELGNATQEFLIDELGELGETIKALEKLQGVYKEALKARVEDLKPGLSYFGDSFEMAYSEVTAERMDTEAVKKALGDLYSNFTKTSSYTQMRFKRK